jgi:hypothetical protein
MSTAARRPWSENARGDLFKIEASAERDGLVRLSGHFADCTNLALRGL